MTFIIDIDDTILLYPKKKYEDIENRYNDAIPDLKEIEKINELYDNGNIIIIHTGRNWDKYYSTKMQLHAIGLKYQELVMGKPQGVYIDKDSFKTIDNWKSNDRKLYN